MTGRGLRSGLGIACLIGALFAALPAQGEAAIYAFDPVLSLMGSCETPEPALDSVPDPAEPPCGSKGAEANDHPEAAFKEPLSVVTDKYGNIYVPNYSGGGKVAVFDSGGFFIAEITKGLEGLIPEDIAVDDSGYIYVYGFTSEPVVKRLDPDTGNDPANGKIAYKEPVTILTGAVLTQQANRITLDSAGRLYVTLEPVSNSHINKYGSATEGNVLLDSTIGQGILKRSRFVTVDSRNGDIYASNRPEGESSTIKVFSGESGHALKRTISGFSNGQLAPAVDETSGRVLVADLEVRNRVYVFEESSGDQTTSESVDEVKHEFEPPFPAPDIAVDNGSSSPNSGAGLGEAGGYLFVPSLSKSPPGHVYAFEPVPPSCPPTVEAITVAEVTETEADVQAVVDPCNADTEYEIEYVTQQGFEETGFEGAVIAAADEIPAGNLGVSVSATLSGLVPATAYRVRVLAQNHCEPEEPEVLCSGEGQASFKTYEPTSSPPFCPNDDLRTGFSAHLPDCRAYELVTPANTGGRPPWTIGIGSAGLFATPPASPDGGSLSFIVPAGGIPGLGGAGGFQGDGYVANRQADGWHIQLKGPSGAQISNPVPGGLSPDHGFAAWSTNNSAESGDLLIEGSDQYILYPDGSFHLAGRGSLGTAPRVSLEKISEHGGHMIFSTSVQLEPQAPPSGTRAVYDRTIDQVTGEEETHVVSLLPGGSIPKEGDDAAYLGSSADGTAIAFKLGNSSTSPLYLRLDNAETLVATAEPSTEYAGLSADGRYLFYVLGGDLYRFDSQAEVTDQITESGDALFVNVSTDGSHAYFASPSVLSGEEENNQGDKAQPGGQNLYVWDGGGIEFIGTVTDRDVEGGPLGTTKADGLGFWTLVANNDRVAINPSRTSADGTAFLFKSRASLTDYASEGTAQVYRFDATSGELRCLSCSPTNSPATGDASLYSVGDLFEDGPVKTYAWIPNLSLDGKRAFFESPEPLVLRDTDGTQDVYEWEEEGVGSCEQPSGCVYLISSGQSARPSYLFGASESGDDVFFVTSDLLTGADDDETPSVYDARVGGGFAEPEPEICNETEVCKPPLTPPPPLPSSNTPPWGTEKAPVRKTCPKGKRRVKRHGKVSCVKPHRRHRHHHRGGSR